MKKRNNSVVPKESTQFRNLFGPNASFATLEAYKLLRTNVLFSFSSEKTCHVVGVTSALRSEGKSTTALNLCYSLAETGKRVLLLECDLRIPSVSDKLRLNREPGLTNLLISREPFQTFIQHSSMASAIDIITAGSFSPNPSELLSSARMEAVLTQMEQSYDFIIVDLPPVLAVSDTLVMSRLLDGVLLVVRKGIARRRELADTMRRLKLVNARVFGFVFKETTGAKGSYQKKYYDHYRYDSGSSGAAR